jgi:DeoR/GlpR family transcriptional regulator of sugar metabolism
MWLPSPWNGTRPGPARVPSVPGEASGGEGVEEEVLPVDRHTEILRILDTSNVVKVSELSGRFRVSEETVRRDLERLEQDGVVRRIYGGAVRVSGRAMELSFQKRQTRNLEQKRRIAQLAKDLITDGESVIMDSSTSSLELAKALPHMRLTVLTNSVTTVMELANKDINVMSTGGTLRQNNLSFVGPVAERALEGYYVDKAFLSCRGLTVREGATDASDLEVELKRRMLRAAKKVIFLVDSSKFGQVGFCSICSLREIHTVVTDNKVPPHVVSELQEAGVEVLVA